MHKIPIWVKPWMFTEYWISNEIIEMYRNKIGCELAANNKFIIVKVLILVLSLLAEDLNETQRVIWIRVCWANETVFKLGKKSMRNEVIEQDKEEIHLSVCSSMNGIGAMAPLTCSPQQHTSTCPFVANIRVHTRAQNMLAPYPNLSLIARNTRSVQRRAVVSRRAVGTPRCSSSSHVPSTPSSE